MATKKAPAKNTKTAVAPATEGTAAMKASERTKLPAEAIAPDAPVVAAGNNERREKAMQLHARIIATAEMAASALVQFCMELKEMHDSNLYTEFGHDTFECYTEKELGIKKRQAYYYISTLDSLGPDFVEQNAGLGITKLRLLSEVAPLNREDFLKENKLDGMSTAEIRKAVQKAKGLGEQLEMTTGQLEQAKAAEAAAKAELADSVPLKDVDKKVAEALEVQRQKLLEEATKKAEADAQKKFDAEKDKIKSDAVLAVTKSAEENAAAKVKRDTDRKIKEAKAEARKAAIEEAEKRQAQELAVLQAEKEAQEARVVELQKELGLKESTESTAFTVYFDQFQQAFEKMLEQADKLIQGDQKEAAGKLTGPLAKALAYFTEQVEGYNK